MSGGSNRNLGDLDKTAFKVNPDDPRDVSRKTCDAEGNALLQEIVDSKAPKWDCITTSYPNDTTEVFEYFLGDPAVLQYTTTVIYNDADKCEVVSVKRVYP